MSAQKIVRTYNYHLYPTITQKEMMLEWIETCRRLYNYFKEQKDKHWEQERRLPKEYRHTLTCYDLINQLPELKKENPYLKKVYAHILQDVAKRVDTAYRRFFKESAKGNNYGRPGFRKQDKYESFTYTAYKCLRGYHFQIINDKIRIGKIGLVKIKVSRPIPANAKIKSCTIKRDLNQWYAHIRFEQPKKVQTRIEIDFQNIKAVGIDMGINKIAVLSSGEIISKNECLIKLHKQLKKEQRKLSRKKFGSSNYQKQRIRVKKVHQKIRFVKRDYYYKEILKIVKQYDFIFLEELPIANLQKSKTLGRRIKNASWGLFRDILQNKAEEYGKEVIFVGREYTSKDCSKCGNREKSFTNYEIFKCKKCGLEIDRDLNASLNILKKGLEKLQLLFDNTVGLTGSACGVLTKVHIENSETRSS